MPTAPWVARTPDRSAAVGTLESSEADRDVGSAPKPDPTLSLGPAQAHLVAALSQPLPSRPGVPLIRPGLCLKHSSAPGLGAELRGSRLESAGWRRRRQRWRGRGVVAGSIAWERVWDPCSVAIYQALGPRGRERNIMGRGFRVETENAS